MRILLTLLLMIMVLMPVAVQAQILDKKQFLSLPPEQQIMLLRAIRKSVVFQEYLQKAIKKKDGVQPVVNFQPLLDFLSLNAYAQTPTSPYCLYGGWLSTMSGNLCTHPSKASNKLANNNFSRLSRGICNTNANNTLRIPCHPLLFGRGDNKTGICVDAGILYKKDKKVYRSRNTSLNCWQQAHMGADNDAYDREILEEIISSEANLKEFLRISKSIFDGCLCSGSQKLINKDYSEKIIHHRTCAALVAKLDEIFQSINNHQNLCANQEELTARFDQIKKLQAALTADLSANMKVRLKSSQDMKTFANLILKDKKYLTESGPQGLADAEKEYEEEYKKAKATLNYSCDQFSPQDMVIASTEDNDEDLNEQSESGNNTSSNTSPSNPTHAAVPDSQNTQTTESTSTDSENNTADKSASSKAQSVECIKSLTSGNHEQDPELTVITIDFNEEAQKCNRDKLSATVSPEEDGHTPSDIDKDFELTLKRHQDKKLTVTVKHNNGKDPAEEKSIDITSINFDCVLEFMEPIYPDNTKASVTVAAIGQGCMTDNKKGTFSWYVDDQELSTSGSDDLKVDQAYQPTIQKDQQKQDDQQETQTTDDDDETEVISSTKEIPLQQDKEIKVKVIYTTHNGKTVEGEVTVQGQDQGANQRPPLLKLRYRRLVR